MPSSCRIGVDQRLERRAAVGAVEEEVGVRRDAERRLVQAEVLQVERHPTCPRSDVHAAVEGGAVDAQQLRRLADVAAREAQRGLDVAALPRLERLVEAEGRRRARAGASACSTRSRRLAAGARAPRLQVELGLELGRRDALAGVLGGEPDHDVAQLAHVARESRSAASAPRPRRRARRAARRTARRRSARKCSSSSELVAVQLAQRRHAAA